MPANRTIIAQRAPQTEEVVNDEYQQQELERLMQPRARKLDSRTIDLLRQILSIYDTYFASHPNTTLVPSLTFDYYFTQVFIKQHSNRTIIRAKKLLGIRSIRKDSIWYWSKPIYDIDGAVQTHTEETLKQFFEYRTPLGRKLMDLRRPATVKFNAVMKLLNYDAPREVIFHHMNTYSRSTVLRLKSLLGIASIKNPATGQWHWVYPAPEVTEWLLGLLESEDERMMEQELVLELGAARGWSEYVIHQAVNSSRGNIHLRRSSWAVR